MPRPPRPPTLESPQTKTRRFDTLLAMLMSIEKDLGDRRLQGRGGAAVAHNVSLAKVLEEFYHHILF